MKHVPIKVAFRIDKDGEVTAVFPTELGDDSPYTCACYAHVGQHGVCNPLLITVGTRPAIESEYRPLLRELRQVGYRSLRVVVKVNRADYLETRKRKLVTPAEYCMNCGAEVKP